MKYHYQYVSERTVRIELIPEDKKESSLLETLNASVNDNGMLKELFERPLATYAPSTTITNINFMDFPKVALVSFERPVIEKNSFA